MNNSPIHVGLYGDGTRKARLRAEYVYCEHAEECSAFQNGKCFNVTVPFGDLCRVGGVKCVDGGIKQSKAYRRVWQEAKHHPSYHKLEYPSYDYIIKVGNMALLNLRYLTVELEGDALTVGDPGFRAGMTIISESLLTPENINKIVTAKPRSMMGDVITRYQEQIVPNFLYQFKNLYPDQYAEYVKEHPEADAILPNWIGRRAKLITCNRSEKYKDNNGSWFSFDGDYLVCERRCSVFNPFTDRPVEMRVKATEDMTVTITDNAQVLPSTVML